MIYCTLEDIRGHIPESRLVEITDDINPNPTGSVDTSVVDKAINQSSVLIDAYIGKRFKLPLSSIPSVLKSICIDLTIYNLYERVTEMNITEGMKLRYTNSIALLKRIAEGDAVIGITEGEPNEEETSFKIEAMAGCPMFTLDSRRSL